MFRPPPEKVIDIVQSLGAALSEGANGPCAGAALKTAAAFVPGLVTILRAASSVFVGVPAVVVAAANSGAQPVVPSEFTQPEITLASVLILADSVTAPDGSAVPGVFPAAKSA